MTPWYHAVSSAKKFGGQPDDYLHIHQWFDESKTHYPDFRHRALRHHSLGIIECEQKFGAVVHNSGGKAVPVRLVGEQHVFEDCGFIPTLADWFSCIEAAPWMTRVEVKSSEVV